MIIIMQELYIQQYRATISESMTDNSFSILELTYSSSVNIQTYFLHTLQGILTISAASLQLATMKFSRFFEINCNVNLKA